MTSLRFENIWILSRKDRAGREIQFHPRKTLFVGRNHTGKSSLIKTLFETLGASPTGKLDKWDYGSTSLLKLWLNEVCFFILRQGNNRALLDSEFRTVALCGSRSEWVQTFAKLTRFNLTVFNKGASEDTAVPADPRCFFLPFYINQDGSWSGKWDTFQQIQQFSNPVPTILDYFTGVKPPEYYSLNAERKQIQSELDEQLKEQKFLKKAWDRLGKSMQQIGPKLDERGFEKEMELLTVEVTELNRRQEEMRDSIVKERELLFMIQQQMNLSNHVLATYDKDNAFLADHSDPLICPTCHAEHEMPFIDILEYTEDARVLRDFVGQLNSDLSVARKRVQQSETVLSEIATNYRAVAAILETRRGVLQFKEVLSGMGAEQAFAAFEIEYGSLQKFIDKMTLEVVDIDGKLKSLTSRERSKEILYTFRKTYADSIRELNLPPIDTARSALHKRPSLSGSGGPRQLLAYYNAIWTVVFGAYGNFRVPIVIDSPNQQGQDDINLPAILKFLGDGLPQGAQVIVGSEIPAPTFFDKVYTLPDDTQYSFLLKEEFSKVEKFIEPLEQKLFEEMRRRT
jgi:hypothetical protein